ncbi:MAG TPA: metalloregulator ArsR/SmtB family transcription factor [Flavihumibacter sp.]|jgi:ArsR family transcriptional regulator
MDWKQFEKVSKALGDMNRLRILEAISKKKGVLECSAIVQSLDLAQPSVSHHIKTLVEAGLIEPEKSGRNYTYILNKDLFDWYIKRLRTIAG